MTRTCRASAARISTSAKGDGAFDAIFPKKILFRKNPNHFVPFHLSRFDCNPASSFIFLFFSWRAEPVERKAKGATAPKPAAERGCGCSGGGDGGNGV
jgi:hypothetical protein